ncbi:DNA-binding transcriptional regulator, LysR family [Amycolatopsis arida]|uniref:DNA-binding transcriptional regulator, LysR family n=1 Tax=Amycolatopsis arida TaxID=587909 RepID=A0A1I5P4F4_9PSEU|nr:LysR family transcriptional regulator [Amycolatopsis arida]TDX98350.1 DNA-binding transcriptional LysR family regulator [Amycolatopsis arida]SFP28843.1 DNA-binding transcriptional regulator, LysR family [Amycolatopsis arida]
MELEIRHLKILTTVADHGSITRAASVLGVSQPSLTAQLRRIESALGSPLFERSRNGVQPTPFGRTVLAKARAVLAEMADLRLHQPPAASGDEPTELRLGSVPGPLLPTTVSRLVDAAEHTLEVHAHTEASVAALLGLVQAGRLDAAMVAQISGFEIPLPEGVRRSVIVPVEPVFVALSEQHPLAGKEVVDLAELADEQWLVDPQEDFGGAAFLRAACRDAGFEPVIAHEVSDVSTARGFLTSGRCISLAQATSQEGRGIVVRPLLGDPLTLRMELVWSPACPVDPELMRRCAAEAYLRLVDRNPSYERWWAEHGQVG